MIRNVNKLLKKKKKNSNALLPDPYQHSKPQDPLSKDFEQNVATFRSIYQDSSDVIFRPIQLFGKKKAVIIYIQGLTDVPGLEEHVLLPLMQQTEPPPSEQLSPFLKNRLPVSDLKKLDLIADCVESVSMGNPILLYEGESSAYSFGLAKWEKRTIEEPPGETGVRGPREGFSESIEVNTSLIRRIIKTPALKMRTMKLGEYTKTTIIIAYIEGITEKPLVDEVINRLERIKIDGILESEYIEELIEDNPYSPFPQFLSSERPDIVCSNLLEGRVAILVEGTPFVLVAPITLFSLLQSQDDYYQNYIVSTLIRWLRYSFFLFSLLLPSFYIAILTFHQEMIPTPLLLTVASSREGIPFPALVEAILMEVIFEALREAGVRLPRQIGPAISIVGGLVIGESAVTAGLVSAPMVIVVAITGISSFLTPRYAAGISIRILRFPIMFLAGTLGLLGMILGLIAIVVHLCGLRSLGVPYMAPFAPFKPQELHDTLWRAPWWMMDQRPHFAKSNPYRESAHQKPGPDQGRNSK